MFASHASHRTAIELTLIGVCALSVADIHCR
ncbi:Ms4533A family Cys-rich leader peptide [Streptomyces sulfonofaciens]